MKSYRIVVTTPIGKFASKITTFTLEQYEKFKELMSIQYKLTNFSIEAEDGIVYFPANVIQNSVIGIAEVL